MTLEERFFLARMQWHTVRLQRDEYIDAWYDICEDILGFTVAVMQRDSSGRVVAVTTLKEDYERGRATH